MVMRSWRKSSRSNQNTNCVEVANDLAALRDSKWPAVVLPVSREAFSRFLADVKAERFDTQ